MRKEKRSRDWPIKKLFTEGMSFDNIFGFIIS